MKKIIIVKNIYHQFPDGKDNLKMNQRLLFPLGSSSSFPFSSSFFFFLLLSFTFYHSTKGRTFSFWTCYIRYILLIIDKFPVEYFLLKLPSHLSLETTWGFIHIRRFFTILFFYLYHFFIMNSLLSSLLSLLVICYQVLPEIVVNLCKFY